MEESFPDLSISFTERSERPRSARAHRQKDTACSVGGCDSACYSRKLCRSHYNRMWKYGRTAPFRKTKQKEEPKGIPDRLQLLKKRHELLMSRREKERRKNEFLSKGLDEFECPWGDPDRG